MKAEVTFFPKNIITEQLISATKPGFDMLHHIFWSSILILHVSASKTFSKIGKNKFHPVLLQLMSINFVFMTECPRFDVFWRKISYKLD